MIVVRSPHVYVGDLPEGTPWATTPWLDATVRTDDNGNATVEIPHPNDELGSTYGVHVESSGATADTRVIVPTAQAAIRLTVDHAEQSIGTPLGFDVYAETLDGKPLAGAIVTVDLTHGASGARQQLTLDGDGHARGSFSAPELGTNFMRAWIDRDGRATDVAQVRIDPQAAATASDGGTPTCTLRWVKTSYRPGDQIAVEASAAGSQGDALITFESALGVQTRVVRTSGGRAVAQLGAIDAAGELRVGAAFVRDGAFEWNTVPIALAAPGRPRIEQLALGSAQFAPGEAAKVSFRGSSVGAGTFVVRISRGTPSGSALFISAPCAACDRRHDDAKQRAGIGDVASMGQLDRRPRANTRLRATYRNRRLSFRSHKPRRKRFPGRLRERAPAGSPLRCRHVAVATISRSSASPTTAA